MPTSIAGQNHTQRGGERKSQDAFLQCQNNLAVSNVILQAAVLQDDLFACSGVVALPQNIVDVWGQTTPTCSKMAIMPQD